MSLTCLKHRHCVFRSITLFRLIPRSNRENSSNWRGGAAIFIYTPSRYNLHGHQSWLINRRYRSTYCHAAKQWPEESRVIVPISPISRDQAGYDNFATLVAAMVVYIRVSLTLLSIIAWPWLTRARARRVQRSLLVRDSATLVRRLREGRIPRVSSYTTTAWWRYNRSVTLSWVPLASSVLSVIVIETLLSDLYKTVCTYEKKVE